MNKVRTAYTDLPSEIRDNINARGGNAERFRNVHRLLALIKTIGQSGVAALTAVTQTTASGYDQDIRYTTWDTKYRLSGSFLRLGKGWQELPVVRTVSAYEAAKFMFPDVGWRVRYLGGKGPLTAKLLQLQRQLRHDHHMWTEDSQGNWPMKIYGGCTKGGRPAFNVVWRARGIDEILSEDELLRKYGGTTVAFHFQARV